MGAAVEVESQALLDTCLADVFVVSTKERFAGPVGLLNGAKRSPAYITTDQLLISHHSWAESPKPEPRYLMKT